MITGKCTKCSKRTQSKINNSFFCGYCKKDDDSQKRIKHLELMNEFDFGWLVGFIEGEGCFYCKSSNCQLKDGIYCYPLAGFSLMATDKDIMQRLSFLLELDLNGPYYKKRKKERKVVWSVQVTGYRAIIIMKFFYDRLGKRRQDQIDKAISWQEVGGIKR